MRCSVTEVAGSDVEEDKGDDIRYDDQGRITEYQVNMMVTFVLDD